MKTTNAIDTACKMALSLSQNYSFDGYSELWDYCIDNDVDFFHDEEEAKIYIEGYSFSIAD